ncbi:MAG: YkvA family protein [Candidatus Cryptobacteroides sp.]|nr:YkvA family protein [Candidatus Cryptobacteroides sp.]MEE3429720.1 YkvA family protein [Candidatus Cryptobacteroides sp.]
MADNQFDKYQKNYSDNQFWEKIRKVAKSAGVKVVYAALLLYYVMKNPATPKADRLKIIGALGYLILPMDLIPDFVPAVGFTDDLAALIWGLYSVSKNITPEVKLQAKERLGTWFKEYSEADLEGLF